MFYDAYFMVNGVDLSNRVESIEVPQEVEMLIATCMGDETEVNEPGLLKWSIDVTFRQDYAADKVDATLEPLLGAVAFPIIFKPAGATTGVTNPKLTGSAVLASYKSAGGTVGDQHVAPVRFASAGKLTRAVAD